MVAIVGSDNILQSLHELKNRQKPDVSVNATSA